MELYSDSRIKYDLQFFAEQNGEKTEEPTAKKIEDTRKEGQVAKSKEISTAFSLLALFISLRVFMGFLGERMVSVFLRFWREMSIYPNDDFNSVTVWQIMLNALLYILITCLPFLIIAFIVAFASQKIQIKWMVTAKPLKPKASKLNPISGFKRMFSKQALFELLMAILKIAIFSAVCYSVVKDNVGIVVTLYDYDIKDCLVILYNLVFELGMKISLVYVVLSLADYAFQRWKHKKDIKMTKQEVKDEYKNQEGDPKVKSQQRQRMQQASRRRMMQSIPEADVVITNPTHFAVALKYDNTENMAPVVTAKGADYLAFKIKDIARENNVEIVENKPLARMLYANVEVGREIPPELYQSVAEILAYVYGIKNKAG
ncbi:MAG: flagellar biosynthesis protein FlhB [Clostridium sp.]|nr:flagellar biosynthesis protein FlhB [Clostridium sp.]MCM1397991.1 flagellar biosynthesis protein FlhB [Clostridium sp.]MCM1459373.1 flagellar biosynthesis protein FlhB [Bacteroides sp.]